jgi:hypothetical protein
LSGQHRLLSTHEMQQRVYQGYILCDYNHRDGFQVTGGVSGCAFACCTGIWV